MIIIDQSANAKLLSTLQKLRAEDAEARCIYFRLWDGAPIAATLRQQITLLANRMIPAVDGQIFLCEDGDIAIIAPDIGGKEGGAFLSAMAALLERELTPQWAKFLEFPQHLRGMLVEIEHKLEKHRETQEAHRRQQEQEQAERKRQAILGKPSSSNAAEIQQRRNSRPQPELMIIEDDAFSRRLVENVLQKQYSLTGLSEATDALSTYARLAPDLLFLDINLPDVSGHDLLQKIMTLDPDAYVVMLSGNADRDNIMQAIQKGAKGFVAKPFNREKLFQYIDRCPGITQKAQREKALS